jgi:cation:H+ antiporter
MLLSSALYILSFLTIWFGTGRIISAVDVLSERIRTSRFLLSFFLLGMLTSIPEMSVGLLSVLEQRPEIFVGNLLGGIPVIFLFIIPVLAIMGNGIRIDHGFEHSRLIAALGVILIPSVFVLDGNVSNVDAGIMIVMYVSLVYHLRSQMGNEKRKIKTEKKKKPASMLFIQILIGIVLVFISSQIIVDKTLQIAKILHVSTFYISLIGVSLGTNLPELSLAIRAILQKKKDIAFGDYLGSAAVNTLLFGLFSLLINGNSYHVQHYAVEFIVLILGMGLFYHFTLSRKDISRREGVLLLGVFLIFCLLGFR